MKKALLFYGGWEGHDPERVSGRLEKILQKQGFATERHAGVDSLADPEYLKSFDLIVPCVTMGGLPEGYSENVCGAVASGTGLAGCHGGMCDAFRANVDWQYMTGGQWVAHPGDEGAEYTVRFRHGLSPITEGLADFKVCSEQYYLLVDPAVEVLADTVVMKEEGPALQKAVTMPVVWTKNWGRGRVFYCSLGHNDAFFDRYPTAQILMERGMLWAAEGKARP